MSLASFRGAWGCFRQDLDRYCLCPRSRVVTALLTQGVWAMVVQRLFHPVMRTSGGWALMPARVLCRIAEKVVQVVAGIQIPADCEIGPGLYVGHFGGVIVSHRAHLGANCNLNQGVTIGSGGRGDQEGVPRIGDRVWIGPGAVLFGAIEIGDDVAIGANAVVNRSLPARAVAVGVPARVVSFRGSFDWVSYHGMEQDEARRHSMRLRDEIPAGQSRR